MRLLLSPVALTPGARNAHQRAPQRGQDPCKMSPELPLPGMENPNAGETYQGGPTFHR